MAYLARLTPQQLWFLGGGAVVCLLFFPSLFALLFPSARELSFEAGLGLSTCQEFFINDESDRQNCVTPYHLTVGNTGSRTLDAIIVSLQQAPPIDRMGYSVRSIVATARPLTQPVLTDLSEGETQRFRIDNLAPNRMLRITLTSRGQEAMQQLRTAEPAIQADGRIIEAGPEITVVARLARNLLGWF